MSALPLTVRWAGQEISVPAFPSDATVRCLKRALQELTGVRIHRQKLLGLRVRGQPAGDDVVLASLRLKPHAKIMLVGSREETLEEVLAVPCGGGGGEVVNDFDIEEEEEVELECREENVRKVVRRVRHYHLSLMQPPRPNKKLLVLDVDYTLFDHKSCAESGQELMRPFLHEFLTDAYTHYDIAIWSATSMKWIEAKMKELGVTTHHSYKVSFMLDSAAMITVFTPKYGVVEVKPLGVIWGKFPDVYGPGNTIMLDDIRRNFLMNPQNGLKIKPFMKAHVTRESDRELVKLSKYLLCVCVTVCDCV
uniref:Ubiquitin-like domain-containing CTD phosphatase 1 n=1 Tax=Petromyzon marinus TaxID=7757 RepID=A0AAJ7XIG4_PETMA|nr:ubiquitin-like domain-containing CTD phosphatase 1 isoform X2 [Petromyzon marinus]